MYTLFQERTQPKYLALQVMLLAISSFTTEKFVELLVEEKHLFPESFVLESVIFLTIWFGLDWFVCSMLGFRSFLQSLMNRRVAQRCVVTLAIAWFVAALFFKFYSFVFEFSAMVALWALLDFVAAKLGRKPR